MERAKRMHWSRIRLAKAFSFLVAAPLVLAVLSALPQHAAPQPPSSAIALGIDPAQSKVHWVLGTTQHAETAATMGAIRKCTRTFSKAGNSPKSFFCRTAWRGKLRRKEAFLFKCMGFLFCTA